MKSRAIVVIDYVIDGGFKEVAEEQVNLENAIAELVKERNEVVWHGVDMRERRGDGHPDLKSMKFRSF
jgi:hypothetical protein